jgi:hypothetical protein
MSFKNVTGYHGDYQQKSFSCSDQCLAMAFAQLTYRDSLRDIEACLRSMKGKLHHVGFRGKVSRSTLADANEFRDWRIYADFAQVLIGIARPLYAHDSMGVDLSTVCTRWTRPPSISAYRFFPWARFRQHKAAVKMHTARPARQYPHVYPHHRRQSARRQHPRRDRSGGRGMLCHVM